MAKKPNLIRLRKPKIRLTAKGIKLVNLGASIGGKHARINLSSQGVSATVGTPGASLNTRRGCMLSPFTLLARLFRRKK